MSNISVEVAYVGSKITRVGIPDTNRKSSSPPIKLTEGAPLLQRCQTPSSAPSHGPRRSVTRRFPATAETLPAVHARGLQLYRYNVGTTIYHGIYAKL